MGSHRTGRMSKRASRQTNWLRLWAFFVAALAFAYLGGYTTMSEWLASKPASGGISAFVSCIVCIVLAATA